MSLHCHPRVLTLTTSLLCYQCRHHTCSAWSIQRPYGHLSAYVLCRDMPPAGGFEAIRYKRNLPFRGPSGIVILGGVTALCAYGFYRVGQGNLEKR